eukprot:s1441_g7.t1
MAFPSLSFAYVRTADVLRVAGRQAMHRLTRAIMGHTAALAANPEIRARLWLLALAMPAAGQDPATIATAMAGRVAGIMAEKAEQKIESAIEHPEQPAQCVGESCCLSSTCMNLPGMGCKASRGRTQCVGSSAIAMKEGVCQCLEGPCSNEGVCVETLPPDQRPKDQTFRPAAAQGPTPHQVLTDPPMGSAHPPSGGGIPVVPIAIGLILANFLIWGSIWFIQERRTGYTAYSSDDEETPVMQTSNNRRFQGPGH